MQDYGNDIAAFFDPGSPTSAATQRANVNLAPNYSEENAFFGWSLVADAVGIVLWLRRETIVRALAVTGCFFAVLSLGERISWWGRDLVTGPWELLVRLPLLDAVVPTRFGLITYRGRSACCWRWPSAGLDVRSSPDAGRRAVTVAALVWPWCRSRRCR